MYGLKLSCQDGVSWASIVSVGPVVLGELELDVAVLFDALLLLVDALLVVLFELVFVVVVVVVALLLVAAAWLEEFDELVLPPQPAKMNAVAIGIRKNAVFFTPFTIVPPITFELPRCHSC